MSIFDVLHKITHFLADMLGNEMRRMSKMYGTAGIVAEFDPFHRGHEYLIQQARERGASHIAVVMSGAAVQRGSAAVCSKHERAQMAVRCGADLVAELPAPYSCSMAEYFADGAVRILGKLGIDTLCFGSETENADSIKKAAAAADVLKDSEEVRELLAQGMSYPAAVQRVMCELYGSDTAAAVSTPNSTLGVEYTRALARNGIKARILPIKRRGSQHGGIGGEFPSGSELREVMQSGGEISCGVPEGCVPKVIYDPRRGDEILLYRMLTASKEELLRLPEVNESVADRIIKVRRDPPDSFEEFIMAVKTANITHARLRRSALHLVLGITAADLIEPPYVRILAFNRRGAEILRRAEASAAVSASLRELEDSSDGAAHIIAIENRAVRFQQMCGTVSGRFENEYTRRVRISG